jgi:hypothetical protein
MLISTTSLLCLTLSLKELALLFIKIQEGISHHLIKTDPKQQQKLHLF